MIGGLARKIFGSSNERRIRAYQPRVAAIMTTWAPLTEKAVALGTIIPAVYGGVAIIDGVK